MPTQKKILDSTFTNTSLPTLAIPTPATLFGANLVFWPRASEGATVSGSEITSLVEQSTASIILSNVGAPQLVSNAKNGLPGITSGGSNGNGLAGAHSAAMAFEYNQPFSVGIAFVAGSSLATYDMMMGQIGGAGNFRGWGVDSSSVVGRCGLRLINTINSGIFDGGPHAYSPDALVPGTAYNYLFTYDGSGNSSGIKVYRSGALQVPAGVGANGVTATIVDSASTPFVICSQGSVTTNHTFLEGFVVNRVVTAQEAATMDDYVNAVFAIHS